MDWGLGVSGVWIFRCGDVGDIFGDGGGVVLVVLVVFGGWGLDTLVLIWSKLILFWMGFGLLRD